MERYDVKLYWSKETVEEHPNVDRYELIRQMEIFIGGRGVRFEVRRVE